MEWLIANIVTFKFAVIIFRVMALPQTVIYYSLNDWIKDKVYHAARSHHEFGSLASSDFIPPVVGAFSRVFAVFAISPLELMRTKLQSNQMSIENLANITKSTIRQVNMLIFFDPSSGQHALGCD